MQPYYAEYDNSTNTSSKHFASDDDAIQYFRRFPNLMVVYKESSTENGLPFIIVWERKPIH